MMVKVTEDGRKDDRREAREKQEEKNPIRLIWCVIMWEVGRLGIFLYLLYCGIGRRRQKRRRSRRTTRRRKKRKKEE